MDDEPKNLEEELNDFDRGMQMQKRSESIL